LRNVAVNWGELRNVAAGTNHHTTF
jgi:hypothetical protein